MLWWVIGGLAVVAAGLLLYGWLEAGWLRTRVLEVRLGRLPPELDGLTIGHLSDFHLGAPLSRGRVATRRAVAWLVERKPDIVCITGDLVSRPRGERELLTLLDRLGRPFVVLGNHDVSVTRDPFSRAGELDDLRDAILLRDEAATIELREASVQIVGVDPLTYRSGTAAPERMADATAPLRVLLCHFPGICRRIPEGAFDLTLAGHLHAGQINVPRLPIVLNHPRAREIAGLYETPAGVLHVSPGLGTSLLPLRFFARPEVTELVLRCA